jgi:DNA invertase Pin-like site-specific DNA recombinase
VDDLDVKLSCEMKGQTMQIIGYSHVSTEGQSVDDQIAALKAAGAKRIFSEKQSGARSDRPQLRKAIAALGQRVRLARSTRDLLNVLHDVAQCGASFKSLADAWTDSTTPHGRLMVILCTRTASRGTRCRPRPCSCKTGTQARQGGG